MPVQAALEAYSTQNSLPYFQNCTVVFRHSCNITLSGWTVPDYDNLQQKQLLDLVSTFVMVDDNSERCDVYNTAVAAAHTHTTVFVMERSRFPKWIGAA